MIATWPSIKLGLGEAIAHADDNNVAARIHTPDEIAPIVSVDGFDLWENRMQNLADLALHCFWTRNFSEEVFDEDWACKEIESLVYEQENTFSDAERQALQKAAKRSLARWLAEPDEYGYTPAAEGLSGGDRQRAFQRARARLMVCEE